MLQNNKIGASAGRLLPPERWEMVKSDVLGRARAARFEAFRDAVTWCGVGVAGLVRRAVAAFNRWRQWHKAVRELSAFDNRTLRDMGINRSEIEAAVRCWDNTRIPRGANRQRVAARSVARPQVTKRAA